MLNVPEASQGLLFGSFLFRADLHTKESLQEFWERHYGSTFSFIPKLNPLSSYYAKEMGPGLSRVFFITTTLFPRDSLLSSKLKALEWEQNWSVDGKRAVNVDTGFLSLENFLLATTKNFSHRIYIGQNLFSDLTYYFHQGELQSLPWTYPDYLDDQKKDFFLWARSYLLLLLNK